MAATVGGSIQECSIDGRRFAVAADADADRDYGGFTNEVSPNGDGTARIIKKRKPWKVGGLTINIDENRGDAKFLQDIADKLDFVSITITLASGITYSGSGTISGDLATKTMSSTADVELSGQDKLEPQ
jgi:hypothetical protein